MTDSRSAADVQISLLSGFAVADTQTAMWHRGGRSQLSLKTVNNHTSSIFTKLNVATRTEAAILVRDRGLGHN